MDYEDGTKIIRSTDEGFVPSGEIVYFDDM